MNGSVIIDTNLLVLLIVGSASRDYIAAHKRLDGYTSYDYDLVATLIAQFSQVVTIPHVLAETSSLLRHMSRPRLSHVQTSFQTFIAQSLEFPVSSILGCQNAAYDKLGLTDAMILHVCSSDLLGLEPTVLTTDEALANRISSSGYSVIDYKRDFQGDGALR